MKLENRKNMIVAASIVGAGVSFFSTYNDCKNETRGSMFDFCSVGALATAWIGLAVGCGVGLALAAIDGYIEKLQRIEKANTLLNSFLDDRWIFDDQQEIERHYPAQGC